MKRIILAVWDLQARAYVGDPTFAVTRGVGERSFAHACNDPSMLFNKNPDDFELHEVGSFDAVTGLVEPVEGRPIVYGRARQYLSKEA